MNNHNTHHYFHVKTRLPYTWVESAMTLLESAGCESVLCSECPDAPPSNEFDDNDFPIASAFWVEGYTRTPLDITLMTESLENLGTIYGKAPFPLNVACNPVTDQDWLLTCYQEMPAIEWGAFYIHASHHTAPLPDHLIPLHIDAATAFGSGEHPSTLGCLLAISKFHTQEIPLIPSFCLDLGCGSGILGIAFKKCFPSSQVVLSDCDAIAVDVAKDNAILNKVEVTCYEAMGFPKLSHHYDCVVANILAKPLCQLANDMSHYAKNVVVLSGLLTTQKQMVLDAYTDFQEIDSIVIDGWQTIVLQKIS